ncbi:MAG: tetraacyldisaccharide 4'-kinase, partial [Flavobacteriaceae bacterium]
MPVTSSDEFPTRSPTLSNSSAFSSGASASSKSVTALMIISGIIGRPKIKYYIFVPMQLLRKILWPLSLIYAAAVYLRNLSYDLGWRSSSTFNTPTICVGNLSLGGT